MLKLTEDLVLQIRKEFNNGSSCYDLAERYKLSRVNVWQVVSKTTWVHVNFDPEAFASSLAKQKKKRRRTKREVQKPPVQWLC